MAKDRSGALVKLHLDPKIDFVSGTPNPLLPWKPLVLFFLSLGITKILHIAITAHHLRGR